MEEILHLALEFQNWLLDMMSKIICFKKLMSYSIKVLDPLFTEQQPFVHISSNNECEKENGTQKFRHHLLSAGHLKNLRCLQKDESPLFTVVVFSSNIVYFYCR